MRWPPWKPATEKRSYTATLEAALLEAAAGTGTDPSGLGGVQAAAGLLARTLARSVVQPTGPRTAGVTAAWLYTVGNRLILRGRAVDLVRLDDAGSPQLHPAAAVDMIRQPLERSRWRYRLRFEQAGNRTMTLEAGADTVFDISTGTGAAGLSAKMAAALESTLANLAAGPHGVLWGLPAAAGDAAGETDLKAYRALAADVKKLDGAAIGAAARSGHEIAGAGGAGTEQPIRLSPEVSKALVELRRDGEASVVAALGVPPALVGLGDAGSSDRRELMRSWQLSTVRPLLRIIGAELGRVLGADISFAELRRPTWCRGRGPPARW